MHQSRYKVTALIFLALKYKQQALAKTCRFFIKTKRNGKLG